MAERIFTKVEKRKHGIDSLCDQDLSEETEKWLLRGSS